MQAVTHFMIDILDFLLQDTVVFELVNSTNLGTNYFYLDRETGAISVRASLERDNNFVNEYFVS